MRYRTYVALAVTLQVVILVLLSVSAPSSAKSTTTVFLPVPDIVSTPAYTERELYCVARTVFGEARGESVYGKHLVAMVIVNRAIRSSGPTSLCAVTSAKSQFAGAEVSLDLNTPGKFSAFMECVQVARKTLENYVYFPTEEKDILYFHSYPNDPDWLRNYAFAFQEGKHRFFKNPIAFE